MLAGGAGIRLGAGRPKALAEAGGCTLLERALAALAEVCERVIVSAPADLPLPGLDAIRVADPPDAAGPLAGIVAAAIEYPGRTLIVLGVDFPLVHPVMLRALLARLGTREAVIPEPGGRAQPLVAVYAARALEKMMAHLAAGERAVTRATAALDADRPNDAALESLGAGREVFLNVNTPADLVRAGRLLDA